LKRGKVARVGKAMDHPVTVWTEDRKIHRHVIFDRY